MLLKSNFLMLGSSLWGHGLSDSISQANYSMEQLADDYWTLTQTLGIEKFSIVGISVGGMWATELTLKHPGNISSLVLMDTYVGAEKKMQESNILLCSIRLIKYSRCLSLS